MIRLAAAVAAGIVIGIVAMLVGGKFTASDQSVRDEIARDIVATPTMLQSIADAHRSERYANLNSIEEILALPSVFARAEALHVLAGRSDSAGVQQLIFDANRVADDATRIDLLGVLFVRLSEIDPQSALALARTDHFRASKNLEKTVWRSWARKDLDDALFAAKAQTTQAEQNTAAQSLFAAFGYMGNETIEKIEAELGIRPDRAARAAYLYRLADSSPLEAVAFIESVERRDEHRQYVSWLANHLASSDPSGALAHADLFDSKSDKKYFTEIVNNRIARENPRAVIDTFLASGRRTSSSSDFHIAFRELASTDLDSVMQYYENARSSDDRRTIGSIIVAQLAKSDAAEAIAWARDNDTGQYPMLQMSALQEIAKTDPQLALSEALDAPNSQARSVLVSNVVHRIARDDPADAVALLDQIEDEQQRLGASQRVISTWMRQDPDAAIDWALSQDDETAAFIIQAATHQLVDSDVDTAIRLLPRLGENAGAALRQRIATNLATNQSPAAAQNFINQFEGQPGYDQLKASVITGVAQTDVLTAKRLADELGAGIARDRAYVQVIVQRAQSHPQEAAEWLSTLGDDGMRGLAAGQLATQWYGRDPIAAERWVSDLPAGPARDDAIMHLASRWRDPDTEQQNLIASIEDPEKRGQAKIRQIYSLMQTDPARARRMLESADIPEKLRQQAELVISQYGLPH